MKADTPAFENVAALEQLPTRGALILALPMKSRGGSGGSLRIVAVLPPDRTPMWLRVNGCWGKTSQFFVRVLFVIIPSQS